MKKKMKKKRCGRGTELLFGVPGGGRPTGGSAGGAAVDLPGADAQLGVRRRAVLDRRLRGGDAVGRVGVQFHVDLGGPLPGHTQAAALRNGADAVALPVLGGVHVDDVDVGLLPAAAGLHAAAL